MREAELSLPDRVQESWDEVPLRPSAGDAAPGRSGAAADMRSDAAVDGHPEPIPEPAFVVPSDGHAFAPRRKRSTWPGGIASLAAHAALLAAFILYEPWLAPGPVADSDEVVVDLVGAPPQPATQESADASGPTSSEPAPPPTATAAEAPATPLAAPEVTQPQAAPEPAPPPAAAAATPPPAPVPPPEVAQQQPPPEPVPPPVAAEAELPAPAPSPEKVKPAERPQPTLQQVQRERAERRAEQVRREEAEAAARERAERRAAQAKREAEAKAAAAQREARERAARSAEDAKRQANAQAAAPGQAGAARGQASTQAQAAGAAQAQAGAAPAGTVSAGAYSRLVMSHLAAYKQYPKAAQDRNAQGIPGIAFSLDGSGRVVSVSLVRSSGDKDIDAAVLSMVRSASPFPAPPPGAPLAFSTTVKFRLE